MTNDRRIDDLRKLMKNPFGDRGLTSRQALVAHLAAIGFTTDEIADELGISHGGAGSHMRDIKARTGLGKFGLTRDLVKQIQEMLK